jgi:hypothetical protein
VLVVLRGEELGRCEKTATDRQAQISFMTQVDQTCCCHCCGCCRCHVISENYQYAVVLVTMLVSTGSVAASAVAAAAAAVAAAFAALSLIASYINASLILSLVLSMHRH